MAEGCIYLTFCAFLQFLPLKLSHARVFQVGPRKRAVGNKPYMMDAYQARLCNHFEPGVRANANNSFQSDEGRDSGVA